RQCRSIRCGGRGSGATSSRRPMSVLVEIVGNTRQELARRRVAVPRVSLESQCRQAPPARDFEGALRGRPGTGRLIAEVKKASTSRGARGVRDEKAFRGPLDDLLAVRAAVDVPLLRKDFPIDEYQLWESRAAGADAVLLLVSILEPAQLSDLLGAAKGLGLAALVECHTAAELDQGLPPARPHRGSNKHAPEP